MKSIYGKAFITLISFFLFIGVAYKLFTNGTYDLNIQKAINIINNNFDKWDFYKKMVKLFVGDNYESLSNFEKNFYFSNHIFTLSDLCQPLTEIWLIGDFIKGFMDMLITSLAMIFILLDVILHGISYIMTLTMILFDLMANLGGVRAL